ncbi:MAG: lysine--tRNA ligase [Desulfurococcaceae archaeon]
MFKHWIDDLADKLYEEFVKKRKDVYVLNGGLSVRGIQHIGRLRGEVVLNDVLKKILRKRGLRVKQYLTIYTQDEWSGKETQLKIFSSEVEGLKYIGWPLAHVPDPLSCHRNWVEHFWSDFGPFVKEYFTDGDIEFITTSELYEGGLKEFVRLSIERRNEIRLVLNKYRGEKKIEENWIPFNPICKGCGRINSTIAIGVENGKVRYSCGYCGYRGEAGFNEGKLGWAVEWVGVWWVLNVDFEPYGKDHATPGGSRDRCNELARTVFNIEPPIGVAYEWVSFKERGVEKDMTSSGFIGITPKDWIEVAHPHVLRYILLKTPLMKKIVIDLVEIPKYYDDYYRAERVYYGLEKIADPQEEVLMKRSYELSYPRGEPPPKQPLQIPYSHLAILTQVIPRDLWFTEGVKRLRSTGMIREELDEYSMMRLFETMEKSYNWVLKYAPDQMRVEIKSDIDEKLLSSIPSNYVSYLIRIRRELSEIDVWNEENVKNALIKATDGLSDQERRKLYEYFYMIITGKSYGPRAAPLLALMGRERVMSILGKIR